MFKEILLSDFLDKRGGIRKKVQGLGINDAPYATSIKVGNKIYSCPYYIRWVGMLTRCYSKRWLKAHPTYIGCSVCTEWLSFMSFKNWMMTQEWKNKQLDKDLLVYGNKIYSPETCLLVSPQVNSLFIAPKNSNKLPVGIYLRKGKYEVGISLGKSKRTWAGSYPTLNEAIDAYLKAKAVATENALKMEKDTKVKTAVREYFKHFADSMKLLKTVS
jgi:hypothetical protein